MGARSGVGASRGSLLLLRGLSALLLLVPSVARSRSAGAAAEPGKWLLVACNGYADTRPASVGLLPVTQAGAAAGTLLAHGRRLRQQVLGAKRHLAAATGLADAGPDVGADALWTRTLAYGACEEYFVDLSQRELFFTIPDGNISCKLSVDQLRDLERTRDGGTDRVPWRLAAVLTQPQVTSKSCLVRAMEIMQPSALPEDGGQGAELAVLDAFTQDLQPSQPYDVDAVVRLEDKIEKEMIATEVLGSRTLGLGRVYAVEPKELHVVLEDLRGSHEMDRQDVAFKAGRLYVGIRMGRGGDPAFPQRLVLYGCERENPEG